MHYETDTSPTVTYPAWTNTPFLPPQIRTAVLNLTKSLGYLRRVHVTLMAAGQDYDASEIQNTITHIEHRIELLENTAW